MCFFAIGVPYGYLATGTAGAASASALGSDRLCQSVGAGTVGGPGTTYYATADYGGGPAAPVSVVSLARGVAGPPCTPASPRAAADQYVLQRILHGQPGSRAGSSALLSIHDIANSTDLASTYIAVHFAYCCCCTGGGVRTPPPGYPRVCGCAGRQAEFD